MGRRGGFLANSANPAAASGGARTRKPRRLSRRAPELWRFDAEPRVKKREEGGHAVIAQLRERQTEDLKVASSSHGLRKETRGRRRAGQRAGVRRQPPSALKAEGGVRRTGGPQPRSASSGPSPGGLRRRTRHKKYSDPCVKQAIQLQTHRKQRQTNKITSNKYTREYSDTYVYTPTSTIHRSPWPRRIRGVADLPVCARYPLGR